MDNLGKTQFVTCICQIGNLVMLFGNLTKNTDKG